MNPISFSPELFLLLGSLALLFISAGHDKANLARVCALFTVTGALICTCMSLCLTDNLFYDAYRIDLFSQMFKLFILSGAGFVLIISSDISGINNPVRPEYYLFMLLSVLGLVMLVSSVELLTIFIALELSSYSMYLMVPLRDTLHGQRLQMESAIKYVLFGVLATGVMLFGMSYLFGLTGTTYLTELMPRMHAIMQTPAAIFAIAMTLGGFFFKLAVFPFHSWVPDVYQGSANETTTLIASLPKVAAVALLIRITSLAGSEGTALVALLTALSICSMFYGNLSALVQTDIKRMLGFSGIAHAGYVLLGLVTFRETGYAASIYYIVGYMVMTLAGFLAICRISFNGRNLQVEDLTGLHRRSPLLAITVAVSMFAMAGIPPFVGFMGKFSLMTEAYRAGHLPLVIVAAINTAIGIYYYLSVVRVVYSADKDELPAVPVDISTKAISITLVSVIILLGVMPDKVIQMARIAVRAIL